MYIVSYLEVVDGIDTTRGRGLEDSGLCENTVPPFRRLHLVFSGGIDVDRIYLI